MPRPKGTTKPNHPPGRTKLLAMRSLPMRIPVYTQERLERLRELDGLTLQEHVRRALEYYLDHIEVSIALSASEALRKAVGDTQARYSATPAAKIVPQLLEKHAPRPIRNAAPVVTTK